MRRFLLVLGLVAVVFLVMPTAMAKFSGQHQFINGSNVQCTKCHTKVANELHSGQAHNWTQGTTPGLDTSECRICHIPNPNNDANARYYNPYQTGATGSYHAAAMVECTYCHGEYNGSTLYDTPTSTFRAVPKANITHEFENSTIEAHRPLYWRAKNASGKDTVDYLKGANEACIACHTYGANVTIIEPTQYLNITANATNCNGWYPGATTSDPDCYSDGYGFNWNITFGIQPG